MSDFDVIYDSEGKKYLIFDSHELYDDSQIGEKLDDFEILCELGRGNFGAIFKVKSKINKKIYAMKFLDLNKIRNKSGYSEKAVNLTKNEASFLKGFNHPNILKFYKKFEEGNNIYIITEFVSNGDIGKFISAHKEFNKQIPEEVLWNIFLQCMRGLTEVHSKSVIHRDIKPANLLMDNNMTVKLGDFGLSAVMENDKNITYLYKKYSHFENQENMKFNFSNVGTPIYKAKEIYEMSEYDQKVDVFAMGYSFFEMCYFHVPKKIVIEIINGIEELTYEKIEYPEDKNVHYSKELLDIINYMIEEDPVKRKNSKEILEMIEKEYSKKYDKNTSIDSLIRCLYSIFPLTEKFLYMRKEEIDNNPITKAYFKCLKSVSRREIDPWIKSIKVFRRELCSKNLRLEKPTEIEPRFAFAFLIEQLHKELNSPESTTKRDKQLIISGEEKSKTDPNECLLNFINDFLSRFNCIISKYFSGITKTIKICCRCALNTYSFNSFFFITLNLEQILGANKSNNENNSTSELNLQDQIKDKKNIQKQKKFYCSKCLNETNHHVFKQYYSLPDLLVISIQRGITYDFKNPIKIEKTLDFEGNDIIEFKYSKKKYTLVSLLGREKENDKYFANVLMSDTWYVCKGKNIKKIKPETNFNSFGDILMLFYM